MKKIALLALATGICLVASPVFANKNLWTSSPSKTAPSQNPKKVMPRNYDVVQLDQTAITALLSKAGKSFTEAVELSVPTPGGGFKTYKVWNTPVLSEGIQAQYPEIQTYTGSLIGDASQTIKITNSPYGFYARSFAYTMDEVFAIEPFSYDVNGYYTVAAAKDFNFLPVSGCNPTLGSNNLTGEDPITINPDRDQIAQRTMGETRRTYRMAVACTGEYALAVSGSPNPTVAQVLNIITATVNNANGVWERELSVSTQLVNNNTAVIYLDPNTDPYPTEGDQKGLIDTNQINHTIFIGNNNYDFGHVFKSIGGGLAQLNSVCGGGKAKGTSGTSGPTDIGTLTHEGGHQMGAGHTFTSEAGGCGGNGSPTSAYEPGSGTTIMSYNGACDADNTPLGTTPMTDYYNQFNLGQMRAYIYTGGACGTTSLGQAPVQMANIKMRYIIPANTPFELIAEEASNTVTANSTPTYCWEQFDLGTIDMVEADGQTVTSGPVFSSLPPVTDRARVFPQYATLAQGNYSASGERLPTVSRTMKFKVTARSMAQDGWGTYNTIDSVIDIKVVSRNQPFRVTGPASNTIWQPNQQYPITWDIGNTMEPQDSISTGFVNIYLSLNGGLSFPIILATNVPNTGNYNITAPNVFSTQARVKIKGVGNIFFDVSKNNFKVDGVNSLAGVDIADQLKVFPNPSSDVITVKNEAYNGEQLMINMTNVLGQQVYTGAIKESAQINVANLAKGAYYLYFKNDKTGQYGVKKVIVQ